MLGVFWWAFEIIQEGGLMDGMSIFTVRPKDVVTGMVILRFRLLATAREIIPLQIYSPRASWRSYPYTQVCIALCSTVHPFPCRTKQPSNSADKDCLIPKHPALLQRSCQSNV